MTTSPALRPFDPVNYLDSPAAMAGYLEAALGLTLKVLPVRKTRKAKPVRRRKAR